jgi:hypothetical protein
MYGQGSQLGMEVDELMTKRHVMSVIPMMKRTIVKHETSASVQ